ncbi:cupin domain-containing protein [Cupriavidus agavae]|uniref:AraC family transcriptional activator of mtrCDE n=1 Tax=Cupriavidus agavae TaxID=1001822 RepID=A0A4Q7S8H9_9BURK|nr:AraC family transcriptional regulator [Cupriavidus agavae]RZT42068.1 AraC family transcriptional activator of mtrCDE [Cupriavidus agavae]
MIDSLGELIRMLAPRGTVDLHCRVAGAWSSFHEAAPPGHVPYHVILDGQADVLAGRRKLHVTAGDVLMFPHGMAHTVSGRHAGTRRAPSARFNGVVTEVVVPGNAEPLDILCGTFVVGSTAGVLMGSLPEIVRVPTSGGWLAGLIGMMHAEAETPGPGSMAIVEDLSRALFTVVLRTLLADGTFSQGALALLADAGTARAFDAILADPVRPWTASSLAAACNVSRATLIRRFAQAGLTPRSLLVQLRMDRAGQLLRESGMSVAVVGAECGYASPSAFTRLFTRHYGIGPAAYRRRELGGGEVSGD